MADKAVALRHLQTSRGFKLAIALLQESATLFQIAHFDLRAADAFLQSGDIYFTQSKYQQALNSYEHALRIAGNDQDLRCQALARIARVYATTGKSLDADTYSRQAMSLSEGVSRKTQAEAWESRGEALYSSSDFLHAAEHFNRARSLFAEVRDSEGEALTLLMLAWVRFGAGERMEGLQRAREALAAWSSIGSQYGVALARSALGIFSITNGEFETARCQSEKALRVFQDAGDKEHASAVLNTLGYISMQIGDLEKSLDYWNRARAAFADIHDLSGEAATISVMGTAVGAMQRYKELPALFSAELRLAQQTHNPAKVASALADLAGVYQLRKQYAKAETLYHRALLLYRSVQRPIGESDILILLAQLCTKEGKYSESISYLEQARFLKDKTGQIEELAKIHYEIAYTLHRMGRTEDALQALQKTIDIIEFQRLKISAFDSRASYFASVHKYYSLYIQLLMLLRDRTTNGNFMELAFEASEKSKVRALLDLLTISEQVSSCEDFTETQPATEDRAGTDATAVMRPTSVPPVLSANEIRADITDGTFLLEYSLGDEKSYVWVVDKNHMVAHELAPAEQIRKLVDAMRGTLTARQQENDKSLNERRKRVDAADAAYRLYARQLSRLLLGPVDLSGAKRLLIVPDASLQYIPFAALPLSGKKSDTLVNHHEVIMLPSASALSTLRKATANRPAPTSVAAVFADPIFEHDDLRLSKTAKVRKPEAKPQILKDVLRDAHQSQHLERLQGSRIEAENIRKAFQGQDVLVAEDFRANRTSVLEGVLEHYRFVHLATHGIIDARRPEMSGLILSLISEDGKNQDGYLRLGDIYKLKLSADLVVLSACQSALGKDVASEGIIGLPRAFLYAGARSVIASLWKVDDEATAALMKGLYARIQRGASPASALREAQIEMARGTKWPSPFYWAAFVLQGDYK